LVFLDSDVAMLESAASHPDYNPGKVYVPAYTASQKARIYEIDIAQNPPTRTVKINEVQSLSGSNSFWPYGTRLASDGTFFMLDVAVGWLMTINLADVEGSHPTTAMFRVCRPNDLDIYEENNGNDITAFVGQAYRSEAWLGVSNMMCEMGQMGQGWGNILEIKVKEGGTYKCRDGRNYADHCSWDDHGVYRQNTEHQQDGRWRVLGRADGCCDNYGLSWMGLSVTFASVACECMMGPVAGVSYHAASQQVWSTNLMALYKIDRSSGAGHGPIQATSWYGNFQSEYAAEGYNYGGVDNTKWMADGDTLIAGVFEAFYYSWNAGIPHSNVQAPGAAASLDEQYGGIPGRPNRKWKTKYHHVIATAFCPTSYRNGMSPEQVTEITRIFSYNPSADTRIDMNANGQEACPTYDPDNLPDMTQHTVDAPCFSGRVTHLEPVLGDSDSFVAINYHSKAVLVLKNADIKRLECRNWVR
jgi:hypothetical protein